MFRPGFPPKRHNKPSDNNKFTIIQFLRPDPADSGTEFVGYISEHRLPRTEDGMMLERALFIYY